MKISGSSRDSKWAANQATESMWDNILPLSWFNHWHEPNSDGKAIVENIMSTNVELAVEIV